MASIKRVIAENAEEIILVLLIILNVMEFSTVLTPELDYIDNIVDLTALGYLFYRVSLTKIFFGRTQKSFDFFIVLAFFLLFSKTLIGYGEVARNELVENQLPDLIRFSNTSYVPSKDDSLIEAKVASLEIPTTQEVGKRNYISIFRSVMAGKRVFVNLSNGQSSRLLEAHTTDLSLRTMSDAREAKLFARTSLLFFFQRIAEHKSTVEYMLFVLGGSMLMVLSVYFALFTFIDKPSMMHAVQEEGPPPKGFAEIVSRALVIFIALNFFFIVIFNYGMEWFALAVDSPLLIIFIFIYLFLWMKYHKRYAVESFIYKLGNAGEKLYGRIVVLFHSKKGIMFGLSGMLVMHLIIDVGIFVLPYSLYIQGGYDPLYFGHLGMDRTPLFSIHDVFSADKVSLIYRDLAGAGSLIGLSIVYVYVMNVVAMLALLAIPTGLWYLVFSERKIEIPGPIIAIFFAAIASFIMSPLFRTGRIVSNSLVGVDITTQTIEASARISPQYIVLISLAIGLIALFLSIAPSVKRNLVVACVILSLVYFVIYIYNFFVDVSSYYIAASAQSVNSHHFFAALYFLVFLMITLIFYLGGFALFMYEIAGRKAIHNQTSSEVGP